MEIAMSRPADVLLHLRLGLQRGVAATWRYRIILTAAVNIWRIVFRMTSKAYIHM